MMAPAPGPEKKEYYHRRHGSLGLNEIFPASLQDIRVLSSSPLQSSLKPPPRKSISPFSMMEHAAQPFLYRIGSMDSASVSSQSSVMSSWVCSKCSYSNVDVCNERCAVCGISDSQHEQRALKTATSWLSIGSAGFLSGAPVEVSDDDEDESEPNLLPEQTTIVETAKSPYILKRPSPEDPLSEISSPPHRPSTLPLGSLSIMDQVVLFSGSPKCQDDDGHSDADHSAATVKVSNTNGIPQPRPKCLFAAPTFNIHRTMSSLKPPVPLDDPKRMAPISKTTNTTSLVRYPTMPNLRASTNSNMITSTHIISSSARPLAPASRLESSSSSTTIQRNSGHQIFSRKVPVPPLLQNVAADVHAKSKARSNGVQEDWEHPSTGNSSSSNAFTAKDWEHPARRQLKSSSSAASMSTSTPKSSSRRLDAPLQKKSSHRTVATTCSSHADEPNQANEMELMEIGGPHPTMARSQRSSRSSFSIHSIIDPDHVTMDTGADNDSPKCHIRIRWLLLFLFAIVALIVGLSVGVLVKTKNSNATSGLEATKDLDLAPTMTPTVDVDRETSVVDPTLAPSM